MPGRALWRRAVFISSCLLFVGVVEYAVVLQLQASQQVGKAVEHQLTAGRSRKFPLGAGEQRKESPVQAEGGRNLEQGRELEGGEEVGGRDLDQSEVRLARELHDLRVDRLRNFERRTGSFLADQQRSNFEAGGADLAKQQLPEVERRHKLSVSELLNLSRLVKDILNPESRENDMLKRFFDDSDDRDRLSHKLERLYHVYSSQAKKDQKTDGDDEKITGEKDKDYADYIESEEDEEYRRVLDPEDFIVSVGADGKVNITRRVLEPEVLVENLTLPKRNMTPTEKAGQNIMLTIREQLCCKAGQELALLYQEQNKAFDWVCHVDDDMYVNMANLVSLLSGFDPRKDPIYLGRSGSPWHSPRRVKRKAQLSQPGKKFHFAVGGMYCLSRAMLDKAKHWIVFRSLHCLLYPAISWCIRQREVMKQIKGKVLDSVLDYGDYSDNKKTTSEVI